MGKLGTIGLLAVSLAFVAAGGFILAQPSGPGGAERIMALASTAFFGACALTFALQLMPSETPQPDAHGVTLIRPSRTRLAGFTISALAFAICSPMMLAPQGPDSLAGWVGVIGGVFFGVGAIAGLVRLFQPQALYRLDPVGIASLKGGWFLPWRVVQGLDAFGVADVYWLALAIDPAAQLDPGLKRRVNRRAGYPAVTVNVQGTAVRFDEFTALVQRYWERGRLMQAHN